ncbi:hypothetical protein CIPAW_15G071500 [Carya illinoinensis]|uniref:Uncharacterized protein n=1 Tax=Carya illinoinensis TaxID=32201 RepID=A0A8T1NCB4_CARIL|nr:hypothetical protein CIPAW_15G071500 [Carya illinoinensis]
MARGRKPTRREVEEECGVEGKERVEAIKPVEVEEEEKCGRIEEIKEKVEEDVRISGEKTEKGGDSVNGGGDSIKSGQRTRGMRNVSYVRILSRDDADVLIKKRQRGRN